VKTNFATELAWTFTLFIFHLASFSNYLLFWCPNHYHMHMKNDQIMQEKKITFAKKNSLFRTKSYPPKAEKVEEICWPLGGEAPTSSNGFTISY